MDPMSHSVTPDGRCPYCRGPMRVQRMTCVPCAVSLEAAFPMSRLGRLPVEHQRFIEMFVLAGGSLKEVAARAGVSYPTVRSRLDRIIEALREEILSTQREQDQRGPVNPPKAEAARLIKAI